MLVISLLKSVRFIRIGKPIRELNKIEETYTQSDLIQMNSQRLFAGHQPPVLCWINLLIYLSNRLHIKNGQWTYTEKKIKSREKFNEFNLNQCDT